MATVTKTFYVSDADFMGINSGHDFGVVLRNKDESHCEGCVKNRAIHKIQISWQEPEKKIEITEAELDEIIKNIKLEFQQLSYGSYSGKTDVLVDVNFEMVRVIDLKQKLFGNKGE